jgi:SAM-dependent methyltransferase
MPVPERTPAPSDWLEPFLPELGAGGRRLMEIGCGAGHDASTLAAAGFDVVGIDREPAPLAAARARLPAATFVRADLRSLPFGDESFDAAVSSLALHYLPWEATRSAFAGIRRSLRPRAPFLLRVNATDDFHHGAGSGIESEPHLRATPSTHGRNLKRFFDEADVRAAVGGLFAVEHLAHRTIHRYELPKQCWECFARAL